MKKNTKSAAGREPSQRQLRVGESVRHAIAELLSRSDMIDPELDGRVITVTEVTMSPDLRQATAYVMPLGGEDVDVTIEALNRNKKYFRGRVAKTLTTKFTPEITFASDGSFAYSDKMRVLFETPDFHRPLKDDDER